MEHICKTRLLKQSPAPPVSGQFRYSHPPWNPREKPELFCLPLICLFICLSIMFLNHNRRGGGLGGGGGGGGGGGWRGASEGPQWPSRWLKGSPGGQRALQVAEGHQPSAGARSRCPQGAIPSSFISAPKQSKGG